MKNILNSALCVGGFALLLFANAQAAEALNPNQIQTGRLTEEQAKLDTRVLKRALMVLHPALTKYNTQAEMDAALAAFETRGHAARTPTELYLAATELAAAIRCGHTWTNTLNQGGAVKAALREAANKLPFTMTLVEGRWLVLASTIDRIAKGDEVLAINGLSAPEMVARLMPYLRADGSSDGKRLRQLGHDRDDFSQMDIVWPLLSPPVEGAYRIRVRPHTQPAAEVELDVAPITLAARAAALEKRGISAIDTAWKFRIEHGVGYLTLPSFSFWNSRFDWRGFIDNTFAELSAKAVPSLVIDIRANEGGDGAIGGAILSYLIETPLKFRSSQAITTYERVPYALAKHLDTWDYSFFDRTGQVEKIIGGTAAGKYLLTARANADREVAPNGRRYRGKTYLLVGAENSSATFQFALLAKQSGVVTLIGQRTGGNLRGLNGGELTWATAPNSGVAIDIPLLAASYEIDTPDASVIPNIEVRRTLAAQRVGEDQEMLAALALIKK